MIDTHSHIDGEEFAEDIDDVITRAKEAGVNAIFIPGICAKDTQRILDLCKQNEGYLYPMIGIHPENVMDEDYHKALDYLETLLCNLLNSDNPHLRPIAIGEVGLDLYWDTTYKAEQMDAFERQIQWAEKYDLPLMIHTRNAHHELIEIMERHRNSNLRGVFHCFGGTEEEAKELLSFDGFMLGIGGICTFKKSTVPNVLKNAVPIERIVLETDSPYLTPVPFRGKRNESAYIPHIASKLSEIFEVKMEDIAQQTTENTRKVFGKCSFFNKK